MEILTKKIKKTIFTLNVDGYAPEITKLTYPMIERYAQKIGADFHVISERKNPKYAPVYEKLQIYDLGREMKNDWNIFIDSDALVHPDMFDVTEFLKKDTVLHNGSDMANNRWRYDRYFRRDGRHVGSCNWFTVASDWCLDLWHPLDIPYQKALENIFPIQDELNTVITREHLIDDYTLSRNIARFGLKFTTFNQIRDDLKDQGNYLWHQYTVDTGIKVEQLTNVLSNWGATDYKDPKIDGWMSLRDLGWLYLTAKKMDSIVEVGAWLGKSAHAFLSGCKGKVYSIDDYRGAMSTEFSGMPSRFFDIPSAVTPPNPVDMESIFRKNVSAFPNSTFIRSDSLSASTHFKDNSIDMVFLDGSHDYDSVMNDIKAWFPKCKKMFCGHDFDKDEVKKALYASQLQPAMGPEKIWYVIKK